MPHPSSLLRPARGRLAFAALALAAVVFSGCIDGVGTRTPAPTNDGAARVRTAGGPSTTAVSEVPLPAAIHGSEVVVAGVDVFNNVNGSPCSDSLSTCFEYRFTLSPENVSAGPLNLDLKLAWTVGANDFDLYLYKVEDEVDRSGDGAPGTSEQIRATLKAGSYRVLVSAWAVSHDTFTLDGTWSRAAPPKA